MHRPGSHFEPMGKDCGCFGGERAGQCVLGGSCSVVWDLT